MPRRQTLPEVTKHAPIAKLFSLISSGKLRHGKDVLQYRYKKAFVTCFGDLKQTGLILSRGVALVDGDKEPHIDHGLLEYLKASTSPTYELLEPGVFRFGSPSKFATACCKYYSGNDLRRENGMAAVKQDGQSINKLLRAMNPKVNTAITKASAHKASQQQRRRKVKTAPKKKAVAKGKKEVVEGKSEVTGEYKFYKAEGNIAELREAKKALKGYRDEDLDDWTAEELLYAEDRAVKHIKSYQQFLIDLHDDAVAVLPEAERRAYGGGRLINSFKDVSQGQKRKCFEEALKNGDILESVPKMQRLNARMGEIVKQMDTVFKGSVKSMAYKPYKAAEAKKMKGELEAVQTTTNCDGLDEESDLESDTSEILNEEEVVEFNDEEVNFLQNTLSQSDEESTALSDSDMMF